LKIKAGLLSGGGAGTGADGTSGVDGLTVASAFVVDDAPAPVKEKGVELGAGVAEASAGTGATGAGCPNPRKG